MNDPPNGQKDPRLPTWFAFVRGSCDSRLLVFVERCSASKLALGDSLDSRLCCCVSVSVNKSPVIGEVKCMGDFGDQHDGLRCW